MRHVANSQRAIFSVELGCRLVCQAELPLQAELQRQHCREDFSLAENTNGEVATREKPAMMKVLFQRAGLLPRTTLRKSSSFWTITFSFAAAAAAATASAAVSAAAAASAAALRSFSRSFLDEPLSFFIRPPPPTNCPSCRCRFLDGSSPPAPSACLLAAAAAAFAAVLAANVAAASAAAANGRRRSAAAAGVSTPASPTIGTAAAWAVAQPGSPQGKAWP